MIEIVRMGGYGYIHFTHWSRCVPHTTISYCNTHPHRSTGILPLSFLFFPPRPPHLDLLLSFDLTQMPRPWCTAETGKDLGFNLPPKVSPSSCMFKTDRRQCGLVTIFHRAVASKKKKTSWREFGTAAAHEIESICKQNWK